MKTGVLTAKQVQYMKGDPERKSFEVPAGPPPGLYLVVHRTGNKSWAFRYRWKGRPRKFTLKNRYPALSLAAARAEAETARADLARGIDPARQKIEEALAPNTVEAVVGEFLLRKVSGTRTQGEVERILQKEIVPLWGDLDISDVRKAEVLRLLDRITDRGAEVMANRVLSVIKRLFNWSIERGLLESSPAARIRPPAKERSRDRVLSDPELAEVWHAAGTLGFPNGPFFRLLILTCQRRGEVAGMRWKDIDLEKELWILPKETTKPGRQHFVPLSSLALEVLASTPRFEGPYVFTATSGKTPINGFPKAKERLDNAILSKRRRALREAGNVERPEILEWWIHDIRRTVATSLAGLRTPPHVLASILNHSPARTFGVTHIYNRFQYAEERRQALEEWATHLASITAPRKRSEVSAIIAP